MSRHAHLWFLFGIVLAGATIAGASLVVLLGAALTWDQVVVSIVIVDLVAVLCALLVMRRRAAVGSRRQRVSREMKCRWQLPQQHGGGGEGGRFSLRRAPCRVPCHVRVAC